MKGDKKKFDYFNSILYCIEFIILFFIIFTYNMDKISIYNKEILLMLIIIMTMHLFLKSKIYLNKLHVLWIFSTIGLLISSLFSVDKKISLIYTIFYIIAILIFIYLSNYNLNNNCNIYIPFIYISLLYTICTFLPEYNIEVYEKLLNILFNSNSIEFSLNSITYFKRYTGIGRFFGFNAFVISIGIGVILVLYFEKIFKFSKSLIMVIIIVQLYAITKTGSRFALISSLISILIILLMNREIKNIKKINYILLFLAVIVLSYAIITYYFNYNLVAIERFQRNDGLGTINNRLILYKYAFNLFKEHPIYGVGINTFLSLTYIEPSMIENTYVHNVFLQLLCETGIFGTLFILPPYFATLIYTIKVIKKSEKNRLNYMSLYVQVIFLLYFITGNPIYDYNILLIYFVFISFLFMKNEEIKISKKI